MKMRNLPILQKYFAIYQTPPAYMSLGFAAYILFMKSNKNEEGKYVGNLNGKDYIITDDYAGTLSEYWKNPDIDTVVNNILSDENIWGINLTSFSSFAAQVKNQLESLINKGFDTTVRAL